MNPSFRLWLLWTPRVLCILYALFISIFALDAFSPNRRLAENLLALAMHLIPTAVILVVLALAWRWAWVGAVIYAGLGILYLVVFRERFHWSAYLMIAGPLFLTGALFLISWIYREELPAGPVQSHQSAPVPGWDVAKSRILRCRPARLTQNSRWRGL